MYKKSIIVLAMSIIFLNAFAQNTKINKISEEKLTNELNKLVADNNIPGANLSIVFENGEQINISSGFSDVENKIKLKPKNLMFSGSIGKTYAAALLFQLIDKKQVSFSDKFIDYFQKTEWLKKLPNINEITIEMLLQHTSGLPRYVLKPEVWNALHENPDKVWTYKDRLEVIFGSKAVHKAGKGWAYSDTNYILLGMLIEKIIGDNYYDILQERILKPHKFANTIPATKRKVKNLACGYSKLPPGFHVPNRTINDGKYVFNPQFEWTGGGIISTTRELALWAKKYYEGTFFSEKILKKIKTINKNGNKVHGSKSYGTASFIRDTDFGKSYGHGGFVPGYQSNMQYYQKHKTSIAIQINCDYAAAKMPLEKYISIIADLIFVNKEKGNTKTIEKK